MKLPKVVVRFLLPLMLRIISWNVQGLGGIVENSDEGRKILVNFKNLSFYDLLLIQEHKLTRGDIHFVDARLEAAKLVWTPCQPRGQGRGGLAILVGERSAKKVIGSGVDKKREFIWIKLATPLGEMGIVNVYAPQKPAQRAVLWERMQQNLEAGVSWSLMSDWNFVERKQDRKDGLCFRHKEWDSWSELWDMCLCVWR